MIYWVLLLNLAITVLIEGLIMALLFRRLDYVYYSLLCNLLTNPMLNLLLLVVVNLIGISIYAAALIILEIVVFLVEAMILKKLCRLSLKRACGISVMLNICSFLSGAIIQYLVFGYYL